MRIDIRSRVPFAVLVLGVLAIAPFPAAADDASASRGKGIAAALQLKPAGRDPLAVDVATAGLFDDHWQPAR